MAWFQVAVGTMLFLSVVTAYRVSTKTMFRRDSPPISDKAEPVEDSRAAGTKVRFTEEQRLKYPKCAKTMDDFNLTLDDLFISKEDVVELFTPPSLNCSWLKSEECKEGSWLKLVEVGCSWLKSEECKEVYHEQLLRDYFLRMTLVGQPDTHRGPTYYTPQAQEAVVETTKKLVMKMMQEGRKNPDLDFLTSVFQGINVPDTGSLKVRLFNLFARIFNRGSGDTVYRSKDVQTHPYTLSKWGDDMKRKIYDYNDITYKDAEGNTMRGLELTESIHKLTNHIGLTDLTSFVYKLPPLGIQHELSNLIHAFTSQSSSLGDFSNSSMATFELVEKWIRTFVILHPFTDSNGRSARVSMNILLMLHGLPPMILKKQNEDMSSSQDELRDKICDGLAYGKHLFQTRHITQKTQPGSVSGPVAGLVSFQAKMQPGSVSRCCEAYNTLDKEGWCVTVPASLECAAYGDLTQSMRYLPWKESSECGQPRPNAGAC